MDVDSGSTPGDQDKPEPALNRREFVRHTGKALYIAPTLTLLGAGPASAQFGSPPPPPGGAAPGAPTAPAPSE